MEEPLGKGGKSQGKSGSKNQPKEPAPPSKPEETAPIVKIAGVAPVAKPVQPAVLAKTEPQGPPIKAGESASIAIPKETAASKSVAISAGVPVEPAAVEKTKPPLTLASRTRLEFGAISTPSKPERPPTQAAQTAQESDDENEDLQAALLASRQAPSSPQPPSGAQSSEPKPTTDLDKQESDLIAQLDRLMAESVRLESLTKPSIMERSRIRSIRMVAGDLESKLQEIDAQKEQQAASKVRKVQERSAPEIKASATSNSSRGGDTTEKVIAVVPSGAQPLTLDNLMAGIAQSTGAILPVADSPKAHPPPMVQAKQSSTQPQVELRETQHGAESQSQVISGAESGTQALSLLDVPSLPSSTGRRSERPDPSPVTESRQEPSMEPVESSRERDRKPPKESSREKRSSHDRERTPDSARVRSKESRKAEKHRKKESKHRRRSESDQPEKPHPRRDERSRSSKRPEPQPERQEETPRAEASATDDPTPKGGSQLAIKDKPPRARPRFDPTVEHAVGRRVAENL